jgi:FMN-dependent NADH-azoreductase
MDKILFINACVRPGSRTLELTQTLLERLPGEVQQVRLYEMPLAALDLKGIEQREQAVRNQDFSGPVFADAKQFAAADVIVIGAPCWDLMFPSVLKTYLENITVSGITFRYSSQGRPESLCKARALYYVTTAGGFLGENDFGFSYIKALAQGFFGIAEVHRYAAEGLDIFGADVGQIMTRAKAAIAAPEKGSHSS